MVAVARSGSDERYWLMETERGSWQGRGVDLPLFVSKNRFGESDLGVCVVERTKSCCWRWDAGGMYREIFVVVRSTVHIKHRRLFSGRVWHRD
jgi:hypothetical protein